MKDKATFDSFSPLDIRTGTIVKVEKSQTSKPTRRMTINLGPELENKVSCGAYTNYEATELEGLQVICIVNLGTMKMGWKSQKCWYLVCLMVPAEQYHWPQKSLLIMVNVYFLKASEYFG